MLPKPAKLISYRHAKFFKEGGVVARHAEPNARDPQARRAAASFLVLDEFRLFPGAIYRALVVGALAQSCISHAIRF